MDKEEAIRRIKAWGLDSDDMEVLSVLIPELKESEDERIRKEILAFMNKLDEQGYTDSRYPSWIAWIEKQCQEKPAIVNYVPKVGDFVKHKLYPKEVYKIVSTMCDGSFTLESLDGDTGKNIVSASKDNLVLWNILCCKPGDIVSTNDKPYWVGIFKKMSNEEGITNGDDSFDAYCYVARDGRFCPKEDWSTCKVSYGTVPANKEQRDKLFTAMQEEGYCWNSEELKLKKIEEEKVSAPEKGTTLASRSSTWNDEDETRLLNIIIMLKEGACYHFGKDNITKSVEWLHTLKGRIGMSHSQQWKPSDDQMLALKEAIGHAGDSDNAHWNDFVYNMLKSLRKDLENLKQ